jgi:branched-chain amino acid transport system permease protein
MEYIFSVMTLGGINIIMVVGLAILVGYTGLFSMGHAGFMMIGAYTAVICYKYLGIPFVLDLVIAGLMATVISLIIGFPTLRNRLTGDQFAIAMLGFGEAIRMIVSNTKPVFNGALGISGFPKLTTLWIVAIVVVIGIILIVNFVRSAYGRSCIAVREQEVAAEIMGIDVSKVKLISFCISAFYVGVGGALFAFYMTFISPAMIPQQKSSDLLAGVVFGGINSVSGPVIASGALAILPEVLRAFSTWRLVIYGVLFVVVMLYRPEGLMGFKEISIKPIIKVFKNLIYKRKAES